MNIEQEVRKEFRRRFASKQDVLGKVPAEMGDGNGNLEVDGEADRIYVRIGGKPVPVFNNRVPNQAGTQVWVGFLPEEPTRRQVLSTRGDAPTGENRGYLGYAPARRYEWHALNGGQDPLYVHQRALTALRLSVSDTVPVPGELLVNLYRGFVYNGTRFYQIARQDLDLSAQVPSTTGKAAFVLISIDNTGAVVQTKGSEVDIDLLAITDIPTIPADTAWVSGAVRVYYGQEKVQEGRTNTDFVDLRWLNSLSTRWGDIVGKPSEFPPSAGSTYYPGLHLSSADPTVNDDSGDGYLEGTIWINQSTKKAFWLNDNTLGAADWVQLGGGSGNLEWVIDGALAVLDPCVIPILVTKDTTIEYLYAYLENTGSAGNTVLDVYLYGGSTVLSASATIAYNDADKWVKVALSTTDFVEGDILVLKTTGVATGASGLRATLQVTGSGAGGGGAFNLTLEESDGSPSVSNVGTIVLPKNSLTNDGGGQVTLDLGAWKYLGEQVASSSAQLEFTSKISDDYDEYIFKFIDLIPATNAVDLYAQLSTNNGSSWDGSSLYAIGGFAFSSAGSVVFGQAVSSPTTSFKFKNSNPISNNSNYGVLGEVKLVNPKSSIYKKLAYDLHWLATSSVMDNVTGSGVYKSGTAVDAIKFYFSSGKIASGKIRMYGLRK